MKNTSQNCCDETMDVKLALGYTANAVFTILQNHIVKSNFRL